MVHRFSRQGIELTRPEHFQALFNVRSEVELEPGIEQRYYEVNKDGYKVEVERALSKCKKDGKKLVVELST